MNLRKTILLGSLAIVAIAVSLASMSLGQNALAVADESGFDDPRLQPVETLKVETDDEPATDSSASQSDVPVLAASSGGIESRLAAIESQVFEMASGIDRLLENSYTIDEIKQAAKEGAAEAVREVLLEYKDSTGLLQSTTVPLASDGSSSVVIPDGVERIIAIDGVPVDPPRPVTSYPSPIQSMPVESYAPEVYSNSDYNVMAVPSDGGTQIMVESPVSDCYTDSTGNTVCPTQLYQAPQSQRRVQSGGFLRSGGFFRRR